MPGRLRSGGTHITAASVSAIATVRLCPHAEHCGQRARFVRHLGILSRWQILKQDATDSKCRKHLLRPKKFDMRLQSQIKPCVWSNMQRKPKTLRTTFALFQHHARLEVLIMRSSSLPHCSVTMHVCLCRFACFTNDFIIMDIAKGMPK